MYINSSFEHFKFSVMTSESGIATFQLIIAVRIGKKWLPIATIKIKILTFQLFIAFFN